jgi:hypothetical protein
MRAAMLTAPYRAMRANACAVAAMPTAADARAVVIGEQIGDPERLQRRGTGNDADRRVCVGPC